MFKSLKKPQNMSENKLRELFEDLVEFFNYNIDSNNINKIKAMYSFSKKSKENLLTADKQLQILFNEVIKYIDCTVLYGNRSKKEQFSLYKQGRELINGKWVKTKKVPTVTNCDGIKKLSNHNYLPSRAVDVVPYPINWKDIEKFYYFAGIVKGIAFVKGINIRWGGDWDNDNDLHDQNFYDLAHFEIVS